jgi:hypothetical protein
MKALLRVVMVGVPLACALTAVPTWAAEKDRPAPAQVPAPAAGITGFRSALFGDGEAELRSKIVKDLGVNANEIKAETHPVERTRLLVAQANSLLPDSGPATVAYILGANSKTLMQVNVVWTAAAGNRAELERIANTANTLREHLLGKGGYVKESLAVNAPLSDDSVLVFRGADALGHMVVLHLVTQKALSAPEGKDAAKPAEAGAVLRLSYIQKPDTPDVLKLAPSAF